MICDEPMARVVYLENGRERIIWGEVHEERQFIRVVGSDGLGQRFDIHIDPMNVVDIKE